MKLFLPTIALLATSNAFALPKRQSPTEYVKDGSFEQIPASEQLDTNFKSGGWTFAQYSSVTSNTYCDGCGTPWGTQYVVFFREGKRDQYGTVEQHIKGPLPSGTYTFSYAHRILTAARDSNCTLVSSLDSQEIDSYVFLAGSPANEGWITETTSFVPSVTSGRLKFELSCPRGTSSYWEFDLDNISLTGPS